MENKVKEMLGFYINELQSLKKSCDYHQTLIVKADLQEYLRTLDLDKITLSSFQNHLNDLVRWVFHNIQYGDEDRKPDDSTDKAYEGLINLLKFFIRKPSPLNYKSTNNADQKMDADHKVSNIFNEIKSKKPQQLRHEEIRLRILHTLYHKYYGEAMGRPLSTEEIIKETFPDSEDLDKVFPEIDVLDKKQLIAGTYILGTVYPLLIRITEYGIDAVEQIHIKLRNIHFKRRIEILNLLYMKYFKIDYSSNFETNEVISEARLNEISPNESYQEFEYLYRKKLIEGIRSLGPRPLLRVKISEGGISLVEEVARQYLHELSIVGTDSITKKRVDEIQKEENPQTRTRQILDYIIKDAPQWIETMTKIAKSIINGQIDF